MLHFYFGTQLLLMKKTVLLPVGILVLTPRAILPKLFEKDLDHIFEFGKWRRDGYSYAVPVIGLVTALSSQWLGISITVIPWVGKSYLELDGLLLLFLLLWDQHKVGFLLSVG